MQRLPDHMRAMLSTRNPQDRWIKYMVNPDFANGQIAAQTDFWSDAADAILRRIATFEGDPPKNEWQKGFLYGLARCLVNALKPAD